jgi:hypothetical protein
VLSTALCLVGLVIVHGSSVVRGSRSGGTRRGDVTSGVGNGGVVIPGPRAAGRHHGLVYVGAIPVRSFVTSAAGSTALVVARVLRDRARVGGSGRSICSFSDGFGYCHRDGDCDILIFGNSDSLHGAASGLGSGVVGHRLLMAGVYGFRRGVSWLRHLVLGLTIARNFVLGLTVGRHLVLGVGRDLSRGHLVLRLTGRRRAGFLRHLVLGIGSRFGLCHSGDSSFLGNIRNPSGSDGLVLISSGSCNDVTIRVGMRLSSGNIWSARNLRCQSEDVGGAVELSRGGG